MDRWRDREPETTLPSKPKRIKTKIKTVGSREPRGKKGTKCKKNPLYEERKADGRGIPLRTFKASSSSWREVSLGKKYYISSTMSRWEEKGDLLLRRAKRWINKKSKKSGEGQERGQ